MIKNTSSFIRDPLVRIPVNRIPGCFAGVSRSTNAFKTRNALVLKGGGQLPKKITFTDKIAWKRLQLIPSLDTAYDYLNRWIRCYTAFNMLTKKNRTVLNARLGIPNNAHIAVERNSWRNESFYVYYHNQDSWLGDGNYICNGEVDRIAFRHALTLTICEQFRVGNSFYQRISNKWHNLLGDRRCERSKSK